jgi:hypothetical protein
VLQTANRSADEPVAERSCPREVVEPQHPQRIGPLADPSVRTVALLRLRVGLGDLLCTVLTLRANRPELTIAVGGRAITIFQPAFHRTSFALIPERSSHQGQGRFVPRARR